jgi:hypothetical protein
MSVALRHPVSGEIRIQQEGWSWGCFFGAGVLGLPLFRRGLPVWGAAMLVFDVIAFIVGWIDTDNGQSFYWWMSMIGIGASLFFGFRANGMAVDRALTDGWEFTDKRQQWFG